MPGTFAEDLSEQKATYLKEKYAQDKIRQVISQEDPGQITRLFDKAIFTSEATTKAYDSAIIAGKNSGIETHLTSAVNVASSGMFNADSTDLSEELIASIGSENHTKLVAICNKQGVSIVDLVLQAVANVYCQAVCAKQTELSQSTDDTQQFNSQIANPMNNVIPKIKKDLVFPSIISQIINYLTSFFKFEGRVTAESMISRIDGIQNIIIEAKEALRIKSKVVDDNDKELISKALKKLENCESEFDTIKFKLENNANGGELDPKRILPSQEKNTRLNDISNACTNLSDTFTAHILPIDHLFTNNNENAPTNDVNKNNKGLLNQILETLMSYFYKRKEELPEALQNKSEITKNLYLADPILSEKIKSTLLPLSAPSDTVSATDTIIHTGTRQAITSEKIKKMKTELHDVKEITETEEIEMKPTGK